MNSKKPNNSSSGQKPADPKSASSLPQFTGAVNDAKKEGYDERAQIVFVHPLSPTISKLLKYLSNDKTIQISEASSTQEGIQMVQALKPCILVGSIQQNNDIMKLLQLAALLKADIKSGRIKTVIASTVKQPTVIAKFEDYGCHEYMIEPINDRQLQFKMSLQVKANKAARKKQKSIEVKQLGNASKSEKHTEEESKITEGGATASVENINPIVRDLPANEIQEDTWVFKNKPYKKGSKWAFRAVGPDPTEGAWQRLPQNTPEGDVQWRYMPKGQDSDIKAGWHFTGEKPQFDGNFWNFESKKPNLIYKDEVGKILASKVATDADGNVNAAADSKIALEKIAKKEAELQKKKLEKKAAFFSRKPGAANAEEGKTNGALGLGAKPEDADNSESEAGEKSGAAGAEGGNQKAYGKGAINPNKAANSDQQKGEIAPNAPAAADDDGYGSKNKKNAAENGNTKESYNKEKPSGHSSEGSQEDEPKKNRGLVETSDEENGQRPQGNKEDQSLSETQGRRKGSESESDSEPDKEPDEEASELKDRNFLKKKKARGLVDASEDEADAAAPDDEGSHPASRAKDSAALDKNKEGTQKQPPVGPVNPQDNKTDPHNKNNSKNQEAQKRPLPAERANAHHPDGSKAANEDNQEDGPAADDDQAKELNDRNFLKKKKNPNAANAQGENHGAITEELQKNKKRTHTREDHSSEESAGKRDDNDDEVSAANVDQPGEGDTSQYFEFPLDHFGSVNGTWETAGHEELNGSRSKILVFVSPELKMKQHEDVTVLNPYWICFDSRPLYSVQKQAWIFKDKPPTEISSFDLLPQIVQKYLSSLASKKSAKAAPAAGDKNSSEQAKQAAKTAAQDKSKQREKSENQSSANQKAASDSKGDLDREGGSSSGQQQQDDLERDETSEASADADKSRKDGDAQWQEEGDQSGGAIAEDQAEGALKDSESLDLEGKARRGDEAINDSNDGIVDENKSSSGSDVPLYGYDRVEPLVFLLRISEMQMSQNETIESAFDAFFKMMDLAFNGAAFTVVCLLPSGDKRVVASRGGAAPGSVFDVNASAFLAPPHVDGEVRTESGIKKIKSFCCPVFDGPVLLGLVLIEKVDVNPEALPRDLSYLKVVCKSIRGMLLTLRCNDQKLKAA